MHVVQCKTAFYFCVILYTCCAVSVMRLLLISFESFLSIWYGRRLLLLFWAILSVLYLCALKVVDMCVHPDPAHRPPTSKLLSLSFLKVTYVYPRCRHAYSSPLPPSLFVIVLPFFALAYERVSPGCDSTHSSRKSLPFTLPWKNSFFR